MEWPLRPFFLRHFLVAQGQGPVNQQQGSHQRSILFAQLELIDVD